MDIGEWESVKQSIIDYYHNSWPSYLKFISKTNLGLHYGYYDKENKVHHKAMLNMNNQVALGLKLKKDTSYSILDAGCGVGGTVIHLAKNFPNMTFIGINISDEQIKLANDYSKERGFKDRVSFLNRDYINTGFPDDTFDAVYALESMCYAYDKHAFLKEFKRILKPGGRIAVLDGFRNGKYPLNPLIEKKYDLWCEGWVLRYKLDTQTNFMKYLEQEEFQDIMFKDITSNILPSSKRIYNLWVKRLIYLSLIGSIKEISRAGIYQKKLFKSRYLVYGAFSAQKPS
ncbi:MAG: SAM-dependent methyltransferase [Candidatus Thorarchaeota archaeon]